MLTIGRMKPKLRYECRVREGERERAGRSLGERRRVDDLAHSLTAPAARKQEAERPRQLERREKEREACT